MHQSFVSLVSKVRKLLAIVEVLHRYAAWNISTSKVEQNFALRAWLITKQRNVDPYREQDLLTVADHSYASEVSIVFEKARTFGGNCIFPQEQDTCDPPEPQRDTSRQSSMAH